MTEVAKNERSTTVDTVLANRTKVVSLEGAMKRGIKDGSLEDGMDKCVLTHYFSPIVEEYECGTYARELFMPAGTVIVGKIHRHSHINFLSRGKVQVLTEAGLETLEAPCTFVSTMGLKRAVYIVEDAVWTTIHLTKHIGEDKLDKIEDEIIAKTFAEIGLEELDLNSLVGYTIKDFEALL